MNHYQINIKHRKEWVRGSYDRKLFRKHEVVMLEFLREAIKFGYNPSIGEKIYAGDNNYYRIKDIAYFGNYMIYWVDDYETF